MMDRKTHWERVYRTRAAAEVGWYQSHPTMSLKLIALSGIGREANVIDVGGGMSFLVDKLLDQGFKHITVLDISDAAIQGAKSRLGSGAERVTWLETDIINFKPAQRFDLWHDRAVFHFLTDAGDRQKYVQVMNEAVAPNGHAILATFALAGPPKCSGLDVVRYSPESLSEEIGKTFKLLETFDEVHVTPRGKEQKFM